MLSHKLGVTRKPNRFFEILGINFGTGMYYKYPVMYIRYWGVV